MQSSVFTSHDYLKSSDQISDVWCSPGFHVQARNVVLQSICTSHVSVLVEGFLTFGSSRHAVLMWIMELRGTLEGRSFSAVIFKVWSNAYS
jgi:hypothetical protein